MSDWRKFRRLPAEKKTMFLVAPPLLPPVCAGVHSLGARGVLVMLRLGYGTRQFAAFERNFAFARVSWQ